MLGRTTSATYRPRPVRSLSSSTRLIGLPIKRPSSLTRSSAGVASQLFGRRRDGLDDAVIAGAPAEHGGESLADLLLRRPRVGLQKVERGHQHAGCAEAALQAV